MKITQIKAFDEYDACEQIYKHLEMWKKDGWIPGKINSLVDGWKNQYEFTRKDETIIVEFDLRPSMFSDSNNMNFQFISLFLTQPDALHKMRCIRDGKNPHEKKYWLGYLFWIVVAIIVWLLFFNK